MQVALTILGTPVSMKNRRRLVKDRRTGKLKPIKNQAAQTWMADIRVQARVQFHGSLLQGDLTATVYAYYPDRRADLDVELLFDALQGILYADDRQIVEKHLVRRVDGRNPRCECIIEEIGDA